MIRTQKGFTLIELLVVIAIIGILATLVITQLGGARGKARNASVRSDVSEAGKAIESFKNDDAAAEAVVVSGPAVTNQLVLTSTGGTITTYFTGAQLFTGPTFATKFVKTPGGGYNYAYTAFKASGSAGQTVTGTAGASGGTVPGTYSFCGNLLGDPLYAWYQVTDGSSYGGGTAATTGTACN